METLKEDQNAFEVKIEVLKQWDEIIDELKPVDCNFCFFNNFFILW